METPKINNFTMKKIGIIFLSVVLFFACENKKTDQFASDDQISSVEEVEAPTVEVILVADLLVNPDDLVGKEIQVEGLVTHVCKHSGQRLHLSNEQGEGKIRIEAGDKIKHFDRELEGSEIVATGILRKQVIDEAYISELEQSGRRGKGDHGDHDGEGAGGEEGEEEEADVQEQAQNMREMLKESGKDRIVNYWIDGESFKEKK